MLAVHSGGRGDDGDYSNERGQDGKVILPEETDNQTGPIPAEANLKGPKVLE